MIRPKETLPELKLRLIKAQLSVPENVYWIGVRGYYLNSMGKPGVNDRGVYDDAIFLVSPNGILSFNYNSDPSRYKPGVATLCLGIHYFKKGNHGISKPGGGYPAYRPATPDESLPVTRDGQVGIFKGVAINVHSGGLYYTSSAGCQTIYQLQWPEFKRESDKAMDRENQKKIPLLLVAN